MSWKSLCLPFNEKHPIMSKIFIVSRAFASCSSCYCYGKDCCGVEKMPFLSPRQQTSQWWSPMFLSNRGVCSGFAVVHLFAGPGVQASGDQVEPGFFEVSSSFAQGFCLASGFCLDEASSVLEPGASSGWRCALGFGLSIYFALASHLASANIALCFSCDCLITSADCSCMVGGS